MTDQELKQARLEFLNDTINHFNLTNRGVTKNQDDNEDCSYLAGCSIGRRLSKELCKKLDGMENTSVVHNEVFNQLPDNLKQLGQTFLWEIQCLHDHPSHWGTIGLSRYGKGKVKGIKRRYELND